MLPNFVHPEETKLLSELQNNTTFGLVLNAMGETHAKTTALAEIPDRSFAVTSLTCSRLYELYQRAHDKLELEAEYNLFCAMEYNRIAKTLGTDDDALIVIDSSCLEDFSDEQLLALLGRELGHIKLKHIKYMTAFRLIDDLVSFLPGIVIKLGLVRALKGLLLEWLLVAEYSADRAGAIVTGNILPVIQNNLMASGLENAADCINFEAYIKNNLLQDINSFDRATKLFMTETLREFPIPFVIPRIKELIKWAGECRRDFPEVYHSRHSVPNRSSAISVIICQGQRLDLGAIGKITARFEWNKLNPKIEIDLSAFLTSSGKVFDDSDLVFYGNTRSRSEAVKLIEDNVLELDFARIPKQVDKIVLTATIYDAEKHRQNFGMVQSAGLKVSSARGENALFPLENLTIEPSLVLGEFYRRGDTWRFKAIGAGFSGGFIALCKNFGLNVGSSFGKKRLSRN